ncbi:hypothetical protein BH09PSE4_BH09PSE4_21850 [soil metagenome]
MELGSLPLWAQQLGGLLLTIATAVALTWNERKKRHAPPEPPSGTASVVAASFVDKAQMENLTRAVTSLDATMKALGGHAERLSGHLHDEALIRAAAARRHD